MICFGFRREPSALRSATFAGATAPGVVAPLGGATVAATRPVTFWASCCASSSACASDFAAVEGTVFAAATPRARSMSTRAASIPAAIEPVRRRLQASEAQHAKLAHDREALDFRAPVAGR